ncbi:MAG: DUF2141 domain-containing protein [Flavobacteriaceae bacterium]|jgi:uncharacterized protein (DUF2141 family)|nr:DUF2141 domain-containing protein [Flavobacteriaceae bacterium]|tara:strand:- start:143 stop:583 length:441 start_codon:yes stop_codon:yes gene_type:complete
MKVRILFISLVLLVVTNTISQTFKLKIEIENIEQKGTVYLAIYDNSTSFDQDNKNKNVNKNRWVKSIVEVVNKNSFTKNVELKKGVYAISLFVDSNNNKIIDKNLLGIPTEQYGFSNNATGFLGSPSYNDASFNLINDLNIKISLK